MIPTLTRGGIKSPKSAFSLDRPFPHSENFFLPYPKFDLLGDPIPENKGNPGANGHVPTKENANKIRVLLLAGSTLDFIASQLGISAPTLRKHYFQNGRVKLDQARQRAINEMHAKSLLLLDAAAENGNVAAQKKMMDVVEKANRDLIEDDLLSGLEHKKEAPSKKVEPLGKKAHASAVAAETIEQDDLLDPTKVGGKIH